MIAELVDAYARFYSCPPDALANHYAVTRPLMVAIDAINHASSRTGRDDLELIVAGQVYQDLERYGFRRMVRQSEPRWEGEREAVMAFAQAVVETLFLGHCHGSIAELREQRPQLQLAAYSYYGGHYTPAAAKARL